MENLKLIFACMAMFASCEKEHSTPTIVHYRFIQQVTAYLEDGGVDYHDFAAHSGATVHSDGKVSFDFALSAGEGSFG